MADFDFTKVPEITAERLNTVAADCQQRGQDMFEQALADQRALLGQLANPLQPLMAATATFVARLANPPPKPKPSKPDGGGDEPAGQPETEPTPE